MIQTTFVHKMVVCCWALWNVLQSNTPFFRTNYFLISFYFTLISGDDFSIIQQEILMMKDCTHVNIVGYFGSYLRKEKLWIAMEYCGGGSLQDIYHSKYTCLLYSQLVVCLVSFLSTIIRRGWAVETSIKGQRSEATWIRAIYFISTSIDLTSSYQTWPLS